MGARGSSGGRLGMGVMGGCLIVISDPLAMVFVIRPPPVSSMMDTLHQLGQQRCRCKSEAENPEWVLLGHVLGQLAGRAPAGIGITDTTGDVLSCLYPHHTHSSLRPFLRGHGIFMTYPISSISVNVGHGTCEPMYATIHREVVPRKRQ